MWKRQVSTHLKHIEINNMSVYCPGKIVALNIKWLMDFGEHLQLTCKGKPHQGRAHMLRMGASSQASLIGMKLNKSMNTRLNETCHARCVKWAKNFLDFNWIVPLKITFLVACFGLNFPVVWEPLCNMGGNMQTREVHVDYSLVCTSYR